MLGPQEIVAGILVGGKSTRMRTNKAALSWGDSTILETVVRIAKTCVQDCVLLGDCDELPKGIRQMTCLNDAVPDGGPLAGLASLLDYISDTASAPEARSRWGLLLSCDIPFIDAETIHKLVDQASPDRSIIAYRRGDHFESRATVNRGMIEGCCALYNADLLPKIKRRLAKGQLALNALIKNVPHEMIAADDRVCRALSNINTPEDYEKSRPHAR